MGKNKKESSSSSSSDDSSSEAPKTKAPVKAAAPAPAKGKAAPAKKAESSSSSSSSEEVKKPAKKEEKKVEKKPAKKASSSSSESEEKPKAAPKKEEKKAKKSASSDSSDESEQAAKPKANDKKRKADEAEAAPAAKKARTEGDAKAENTRVFLGNLPFTIDDDQIKAVFKDAGEIVDVHWVTDRQTGKFYGTGFVEFATAEGAKAAVAMAGQEVGGRPMKVDFAQPKAEKKDGQGAQGQRTPRGDKGGQREARPATPKPEGCTTVFLGNLSFQIDEQKVRDTFGDCGEITSIRWVERDGQFKGCGFVDFAATEATDKAVALNGQDVMGRPIRVDYSAPKAPREKKW